MNISTLGNYLEYFLDAFKEYRVIILQSGEYKFTIPVTPAKYTVQTEQMNKIVDILELGEVLVFGNPKLKRLKFSAFFPATFHEYPFVVGDIMEPTECVNLMINWKESKEPVRVIITDSPVNLMMGITDFDYSEKDGSRDIYFDVSFIEYKDLNTPLANNSKIIDNLSGLRERTSQNWLSSVQSDFVNKALDYLDASKYAFGDFSNLPQIMHINSIPSLSSFKVGGLLF